MYFLSSHSAAASGAAASGARGHTKGGGARLLSQGQRLQAAIPVYYAAQAAQAAAAAAADAQAEEAAAGYPQRGATRCARRWRLAAASDH